MGVDTYRSASKNVRDGAERAFSITPADSTELDIHTRALWVGGAGDLVVKLIGDTSEVTFVGVVAGSLLPLRVKEVWSTGTSATDIVGVY